MVLDLRENRKITDAGLKELCERLEARAGKLVCTGRN